jgi:enoyl-CoA hydratase/carnithine racemase
MPALPPLAGDLVRVDRAGDVVTVTLDHPAKRNALSLPMMAQLTAALRAIGDGDALAVILAANGPAFSAGHDFADMAGADLEHVRRLFQRCTEMMDVLQAIPQPVVARVHALATAAGCQLVATCDLAVASTEAAFAIPGGKGGLFCHTPLVAVARNVGRKRALEMAMTGDPIDAATAAEWGLVNRVVAPDDLEPATLDLITRATRGSSLSKALGKQGFYAQIDLDQAKAYTHTIELMAATSQTADAQEGFRAFLDKRPPKFTGR